MHGPARGNRFLHTPALATAVTLALLVSAMATAASAHGAPAPGPAWQVSLVPSVSASQRNEYLAVLTNTGSVASSGPISLSESLPAGETVSNQEGNNWECAATNAGTVENCTYSTAVGALGQSSVLLVEVNGSPAGVATDTVTVSGGGAPAATATRTTENGLPSTFGFLDFAGLASGVSGMPDTRAGGHPYAFTTTLDLSPGRVTKELEIELPAGFIGNPQATPRCPIVGVIEHTCPVSTRVGTFFANLAQGLFAEDEAFPIYNVIPEQGYPAEFGFYAEGAVNKPVFLYATLGAGPQYRLRVVAPDIPSLAQLNGTIATFFGDPEGMDNPPGVMQNASVPFFTNPSDCSAASQETKIKVFTWEEPNSPEAEDHADAAPVAGCNHLQFEPSVAFTPESAQADEPSGYTFDLNVPQSQATGLEGLATPPLKDVKVTLPRGVSINPSAADGLGACPATGPEGFNMEGPESQAPDSVGALAPVSGHCPLDSQIGTVEAETPLLPPHALTGHLYIAQPQCGGGGQPGCTNTDAQDGKLFGLDLQLEGEGVFVKLHGTAAANPTDGQLTVTFKNNPQLPVSDITLHTTGGPRAPLANPRTCGQALTTSDITPWSAPETPDGFPVSAFQVTGCEGDPFSPGFEAGTTSTNAGAYTNFTATFTRPDRQQNLDAIQVTTPPGLLGMLSHVTLCQEPQAAQGTCPASSEIGTATVAAGPGSHPFWVTGHVYLTGGYKGAPFGLTIVVPAQAGPFNLGNVVVRTAISVDPETAAVTITSDPLPQVIDGIPLRVQTVNVTVNRPGFMVNPTNCQAKQIAVNVLGAQGALAPLTSPFAAAGCAHLPFKPSFQASTQASTSRNNGASLDVKISTHQGPGQPPGTAEEANIRKVDVQLPKALPSRLSTLQKACTEKQFDPNPAGCPAGSYVGIAKATTPVLQSALTGPAILVSHGGAAFPDLVVALQTKERGSPIRIDLTGHTEIIKGHHVQPFRNGPRRAHLELRAAAPAGPPQRPRLVREPVRQTVADADNDRRPERRHRQTVHPHPRHRLPHQEEEGPPCPHSERPRRCPLALSGPGALPVRGAALRRRRFVTVRRPPRLPPATGDAPIGSLPTHCTAPSRSLPRSHNWPCEFGHTQQRPHLGPGRVVGVSRRWAVTGRCSHASALRSRPPSHRYRLSESRPNSSRSALTPSCAVRHP